MEELFRAKKAAWSKQQLSKRKLRPTKLLGISFVFTSEGNDKLNVADEDQDDHDSQTSAAR
jgi:hypothetical protein